MIENVLIFFIRFIKKVILHANALEVKHSSNAQVINYGGTFLPESKVDNMGKIPLNIIIGKGTYIRGELTTFIYGGKIIIGEHCYIGHNSIIRSGEYISIGNNVLISHNVNITDTNAHEIDHLERASSYVNLINEGHAKNKGSIITSPIYIEDYVWISFNVSILKGVRIGRGSIISANTLVLHDIPPFSLVGGNPGKILKHLNKI